MEADPDFFPAFMLERPELWPHLVFHSEAFAALSTDRPLGALGGVGAIPWTALDRYAARHGIDDPDEFERFQRLIRAQDRAYLGHMAETAKAKGGK